ncbi:MAG: tetraacyldisaccharide 4'-kinase [Phycisphaerales bacterium]|nr:MAG: tetraacyldisaccharide 4'-kinase [Phycisphaerales bacterium]
MAAATVRGVLRGASMLYGAAVSLRNRRYDRSPSAVARLPVPVISIGNITTGGTGKTPLVMEVVRRLCDRGLRPAVVSRGYKARAGGPGDELLLLRRRLGDVPCIAAPDRLAGGRLALQRYGANVIVLDDAFQHRRIARDLDVVVIDATCPFGHGRLLPGGLLREPLRELRRASLLVVSRADQVSAEQLTSIDTTLEAHAPSVRRIRSAHRPATLVRIDGVETRLEPEDIGRSYCFAGIGNPASFRNIVARMGIEIADVRWWPDHHAYRRRDAAALQGAAHDCGAAVLLTTEKDAVKLAALPVQWSVPVYAVRIEVDFFADGGTILACALDRTLDPRPDTDGTRQIRTD